MRWLLKVLKIAVLLAVALPLLVVLVFAFQARAVHGDLKPWHKLHLASEYRADASDAPRSFAEYTQLEERLLADVRRMMDDPASADGYTLSRYTSGSVPARMAPCSS